MRHSRFFLPTLAAAFLGACNGGGGTPSVSSLPASVSGALQQNGAQRQAGAAFQTLPERTSNGPGFKKIYVTNAGGETTYKRNGTQTTPTIAGQYGTWGLTVDANGKIYLTQAFGVDTLTTFKPDGTQTTPTITGLGEPYGVAVDANGKIYVVNNTGTVTTYNADGTQTTPTITGLPAPTSIAVDAKGEIYVASAGYGNGIGTCPASPSGWTPCVTTYDPNGKRITPTITAGLKVPFGVAVDANGKIYVANYGGGNVTTYNADGTQTTPTITAGLHNPTGVAVDANGTIYVSDWGGTVTMYNKNGMQTGPTITEGLNSPRSIALH